MTGGSAHPWISNSFLTTLSPYSPKASLHYGRPCDRTPGDHSAAKRGPGRHPGRTGTDHPGDLPKGWGGDEVPSHIQGIAYLKGNQLVKTPIRDEPVDLDQLPYPAYHLLKMDQYRYDFMGKNFAILEGSRGCPHGCRFCYLGMYGARFRQKSPDRLVDEVRTITQRFRVKNLYFMDLEFGLNRKYLISLCKNLAALNLGIRWCCQTRVTDVDGEVLEWMKKAGCSPDPFRRGSGKRADIGPNRKRQSPWPTASGHSI